MYEYIRLLDSFKFMAASLDNLVSNLPPNQFTLLEDRFKQWPKRCVDLLKQKGCFPYGYVDSFEKLEETCLPPLVKWRNSLDQFEVTTTYEDYSRALDVFKTFSCQTIGDYYKLYLETDVMLLACVMLCFRQVCYDTYSLDCCQYFTASNLSGDAMLKICKPDLHLLIDRE